MPRDYRRERDLIVKRRYGRKPAGGNPRPSRSWTDAPIRPADGFGIQNPVNHPFPLFGDCIAWQYTLDSDGYGTQTIDGRSEKVHRAVYRQTRGSIPEGRQINHLCDRPYCFQPSHLYAGTQQDNSDDSALFKSAGPMSRWMFANYFDRRRENAPFLQRMRDTQRYDGAEPWRPFEQPQQVAWESFVCEEHDFAIPMNSDTEDRICRICEETEMSIRMDQDMEAPGLIAELWPASQLAPEIFDAIWESELTGDQVADQRRSAYRRSTLPLSGDAHRLRICDCYLCSVDRSAFRKSISANLTSAMRNTLDVSDALRTDIDHAVVEACKGAMHELGVVAKLDGEQAEALILHGEKCGVDRADNRTTLIERVIGGATYSVLKGIEGEAVLDQLWAQVIPRHLRFLKRFPDEGDEYLRRAMGIAERLADNLLSQWARVLMDAAERDDLDRRIEIDPLTARLVNIGVALDLFEQFRFEARGRNGSSHQWPHPHSDCIAQIRENGLWEANWGIISQTP